jgi:hypothetical protein
MTVPERTVAARAARRAGGVGRRYVYGDIGARVVVGQSRGKTLRDLFDRRGLSFDEHGFLLCYEKSRRNSGRKKPSQKALAFFFGSARVGIADHCSSSFSF